MNRTLPRLGAAFVLLFALGWSLPAADPVKTADLPDLSEYRTAEAAITTTIKKAKLPSAAQPGYLGIHVAAADNQLVVTEVAANSPAARAGVVVGDLLTHVDRRTVLSPEALEGILLSLSPGDETKLTVLRNGKPVDVTAVTGAVSRPLKLATERAQIGVRLGEPKEDEGAPIVQVSSGSPADKAGLKTGDVVVKIDGAFVSTPTRLNEAIAEKKPGDTVVLVYRRDGKEAEIKLELVADTGGGMGRGRIGGWDNRTLGMWKKDVYRLAVVCVEYPDVKHNESVTAKDWEDALFSAKSYTAKNPTGQRVFGSMNDYYQEQSHGRLRVEGKAFDWVTVSKKRAEYSQGTGTANKSALLTEALDKLQERDGKETLKGFDGLFFLYAGDRVRTTRGGLYWPHRASVNYQGKSWPYFIVNEGGPRMSNISVICHEFGHLLGLPDLYARPESPGTEGVGTWCAMSNQNPNGRPQHFSAWCKEQLGWVQPTVIDPTVKQKLILGPIEDSARECFKVLIRPDGSEYLLLENRRKKGFDQDLPAEGLLIWRVVQNRPILEESHGVDGPAGPRAFLGSVPYPSESNDAFTPHTTPSSRSQLGGGLPVYITNIRELPDGRITFHIGYKYL
jgi:M6 family metalloprotease-like protein